VRRLLLSPRWLALHALAVGCVAGFAWLGVWQWDAGSGPHGTLRNLAYGIQWWIFAGFAVFMWWRMLRAEATRSGEAVARRRTAPAPSTRPIPRYHPPARTAVQDDDAEVAAYNRLLASLDACARRTERR
jgi:hypothetical protein